LGIGEVVVGPIEGAGSGVDGWSGFAGGGGALVRVGVVEVAFAEASSQTGEREDAQRPWESVPAKPTIERIGDRGEQSG
jgi:hypothetical protein